MRFIRNSAATLAVCWPLLAVIASPLLDGCAGSSRRPWESDGGGVDAAPPLGLRCSVVATDMRTVEGRVELVDYDLGTTRRLVVSATLPGDGSLRAPRQRVNEVSIDSTHEYNWVQLFDRVIDGDGFYRFVSILNGEGVLFARDRGDELAFARELSVSLSPDSTYTAPASGRGFLGPACRLTAEEFAIATVTARSGTVVTGVGGVWVSREGPALVIDAVRLGAGNPGWWPSVACGGWPATLVATAGEYSVLRMTREGYIPVGEEGRFGNIVSGTLRPVDPERAVFVRRLDAESLGVESWDLGSGRSLGGTAEWRSLSRDDGVITVVAGDLGGGGTLAAVREGRSLGGGRLLLFVGGPAGFAGPISVTDLDPNGFFVELVVSSGGVQSDATVAWSTVVELSDNRYLSTVGLQTVACE